MLDAIDEPILIVDGDGGVVKAHKPFGELFGEPDKLELRSADGKLLDGKGDPRLRASDEGFEMELMAGKERFRVVGRPLEAIDEASAP